jgi:hypothetical protein
MTKLNDLTTAQLRNIITIKEQIETLQAQLEAIAADGDGGREIPAPTSEAELPKKKRRMSRAARAKIAAAARARWAKVKGAAVMATTKPAKKRRKVSAAVRAKLAAAARARWAKAKKAGKTAL